MVSANLHLTEEAANDLDEIFDYTVETFGPQQAIRYTDNLLQAMSLAADFPSMGRPYSTKTGLDLKRYNSGRHFFFYRVMDDGIEVLRILHQRQDFDRHL